MTNNFKQRKGWYQRIFKSLEDSGLLLLKQLKKEAKEQKDGCISMLLGTLGARLLWNIITVKGVKTKIAGRWVMRAGEGTVIFDFTSSFN